MRFGQVFEHPGALLTPLGPRDEAWLRAVAEEPQRGKDVFPWWEPGIHAASRRGRALSRLWTEVVWRPPLLEEERRLFRNVARLLEQAWREDPMLDYPWREWQEVLGYLGLGGTLAEEVSRRASLHMEPGEYRLTALCHAGKRRALCVVSFDDPEEQDWALGTWHSLDRAAAA
jgi:hypothetical protein